MGEPPGQMETLSQASTRMRSAGYIENWIAEGGMLRCFACNASYNPAAVAVDEVVRFEGSSDPGDEAILFALAGPCGHRGQYSSAYGSYGSADDAAVTTALRRGPSS
jgi:hypothetical protein